METNRMAPIGRIMRVAQFSANSLQSHREPQIFALAQVGLYPDVVVDFGACWSAR